jgi:hypothetical protein
METDSPDFERVRQLINGLPAEHILKRSLATYVDDFITAALNVYPSERLEKVLREKFFVPDEEEYVRYASELTVAKHIKKSRSEISELISG